MRMSGHGAGHSLALRDITHHFGSFTAVKNVTLEIGSGELIALLGPSGCGKTTLLRIIAGFTRPSAGAVVVDGQPVTHLLPNQRNVGIVFQNYALFPHMSVAENVAYGLEARHLPRQRVAERVDEMLELVQMQAMRDRLPRQLSGGQQQRIAIARAMAVEPKILLLDEPFGALDKNLRLDMQIEVKRIQQQLGITTVLVTHDQEEAMSMADRIAVINQGRVEQFAPPDEVYDQPASIFVNEFVGTTNLIPATLSARDGERCSLRLDAGVELDCRVRTEAPVGAPVWLSVRPERLRITRDTSEPGLDAEVVAVMPLGATVVYEARMADRRAIKITEPRLPGAAELRGGDKVRLALTSDTHCSVFPATQQ